MLNAAKVLVMFQLANVLKKNFFFTFMVFVLKKGYGFMFDVQKKFLVNAQVSKSSGCVVQFWFFTYYLFWVLCFVLFKGSCFMLFIFQRFWFYALYYLKVLVLCYYGKVLILCFVLFKGSGFMLCIIQVIQRYWFYAIMQRF